MVATYKVCVSELGEVKGVQSLKTTGFPAYDEQIESTIYDTWRYKPYLVNGTAVAVCTAVTFKYERK